MLLRTGKIPRCQGPRYRPLLLSHVTLFILPDGLSFFEEGGDAFLEVWGATDTGVFEDGAFEVCVDSGLFCAHQQTLGAAEAAGAYFDEVVGQFAGAGQESVRLNDFADEAELLRFFRGDFAAGEEQIAGALVS